MILKQFKHITTFIFDIDGVLTDGTLFVFDSGEQFRRINIKDGYALRLAIKKGHNVAVISEGNAEALKLFLNKLGINDIFPDVENKKEKLEGYVREKGVNWKEVLFMGDDMADYGVMQQAGLPCAPADAAAEIKQISKYISPFKGGEGCARDVIEKVLRLNDQW